MAIDRDAELRKRIEARAKTKGEPSPRELLDMADRLVTALERIADRMGVKS